MTSESVPDGDSIRAAEIVASLCLATDVGMGFPFEHGFHATLMALRLADLLGVDDETRRDTYYACLMVYVGCTTDAYEGTTVFAGSATENFIPNLFGSRFEQARGVISALPPPDANLLRRAYEIARRFPRALVGNEPHQRSLCEVGEIMADRLGMPPEFSEMFYYFAERWDGHGLLGRARGEEIPMAFRIGMVARDIAFQRVVAGDEQALATVRSRGGHAFDPDVVGILDSHGSEVLEAGEPSESTWEFVLEAEPKPHVILDETGLDRALSAIADFSDLLAPSLTAHSSGVAELAGRAAELAGFEPEEVKRVHRASLVHDIGRVSVSPTIWEKPDRLTADEMEQVRLHAYHSERVLKRSPFLADLGVLASHHHERLDGSGYHRGLTAGAMSPASRLIAAADVFHALTEPRTYRSPHDADTAAEVVVDLANAGLLDPVMVRAVVEAAGEPTPYVEMPAGLTEREMEVLGLLARGLQTKQIARHFDLSRKTVDTHIQGAYRKIGVSTRAAATLFAMEHGLVRSGEFPMVSRSPAS